MEVNLNRMQSFVAVVDAGSLTHAAQTLGLTKAMVSMHLKQLETELRCALLVRTTRRLALTEVGEGFYADCVQLLSDAHRAVENARAGHARLTGELRVSSTLEYGVHMVVPALAAFAKLHPDLSVDFSGTTKLANLVADRFDLAIRLGQLSDSGYRAKVLGHFDIVLVTTPAYIEQHGLPHTPADLRHLRWVVLSGFDQRVKMSRRDGAEPPFSVPFRSSVQADSALLKLKFLLADLGIGVLPEWLVREDLKQGRLVQLLPGYSMLQQGVFAVFPNTQHIPAKVRHFIDFLQGYVAQDTGHRQA
ncbi:putative HTH-type transcriptional regulator [Janthinobacterium sp. HH01]|uniref:LysR family transcriptional regulator n=1 Tax=Janthinobacterium sp. HH01 TaxID=1198452 RepID=UPI0002AEA844|nr:LysR family transcriptional regulator [Janthinobacterium sp. HH01]ELX09062.1 putative HTH-type transcriptional regulator [Janthinobacterium sp. HH01]